MKHIILLFFSISFFVNCSPKKKIVGLWQIEKVSMGNQEMTPMGKWANFNSDLSHESGNGWIQHTVGSWDFSKSNNYITINNENGIEDENGGFTVEKINKNEMVWSRTEEGQKVKVSLKKIKKLPTAPPNQLIGVWRNKEESDAYLFFRWDHIVVKNNKRQKSYGLYKTHGHKQELEIIHYEDPLRQEIWNYNFSASGNLILNNTKRGQEKTITYERTFTLPD